MNRHSSNQARAPQLGTGELHQALEDARNRDALTKFCSAHVCTPAEVSEDGKRLYLPRVLKLMRSRGYDVSEPSRPQHQPKKGFTAWIVHIRVDRAEFDMGFYTPDEPKQTSRKKSPSPHMEPA